MSSLYQHFREEERPFIDNVGDWIRKVEDQYRPHLTDFLDPREQHIAQTLVEERENIKLSFYGGVENAERKRALLYPEYFTPQMSDFEIMLYNITYPSQFVEFSHGQILGTLTSSGLDRKVFGDIQSHGDQWQFFTQDNIGEYVRYNVHQIGKINIRMDEIPLEEAFVIEDEWEYKETTVTSLRADNIVSAAFNLSRKKAKDLISGEKVKLNWKVIERPDITIEVNDVVSVGGYGRLQLQDILGRSKKEKEIVQLGVLNSRKR